MLPESGTEVEECIKEDWGHASNRSTGTGPVSAQTGNSLSLLRLA